MSVPEETEQHETRVFITGLPPNLTSEDLRKHFATRYQITDAHVLPGRRIGFVGLKDHEDAQKAIKYFNKTFIRMSKINVEPARPIDIERRDGQQARPSSKRNFARSSNDDSSNAWNATGSNTAAPSASATNGLKRKRGQEEGQSDDRQHQWTTTAAPENEQGSENREVQESDFEKPLQEVAGSTHNPATIDTESEVPLESVAPADDDDWLRSKTSRLLDLVEEKEPAVTVQPDHPKQTKQTLSADIAQELESEDPADESKAVHDSSTPFPSKRLFVRNLPFTTEASDLRKAFSTVFPNKVEEVSRLPFYFVTVTFHSKG
ncbi:MAG: hypothetical protein ACRYGR_08520 [Janthinobacterium lividum]